MAQAAKPSESQRTALDAVVQNLMSIIQKRRSVRVYKTGKVSDTQLNIILEAARWAPSGANTQPWEFVVTRDRKKMRRIREIYDNEWRQR
jgi:nitroreductase